MVTRFLTFIEAARSRNWKLHLDALEDMIPDFATMDCINYQRLSTVYRADMKHLEDSDKDTWNYFMERNLCCQNNDIPYTTIRRDHCVGQENKKTERMRRRVWTVKQPKQQELLFHDWFYSVANILRNDEGWRGTEFCFKISSSAWECLHAEAKSVCDIIIAYVRKTECFFIAIGR